MRQALDDAGIAAKIDFLGRGPWDFELTNLSNGKMFYIELKSWRIDQGERPIRLALSQALQAAAGDKPYAICVVGRHARVEDVISAEIGTNLYYLRDLAPHFASVSADIRFIEEMKGASGEIRLDLPGIQQAKVLLSHSFIRRNGRTFADLIVDIKTALS